MTAVGGEHPDAGARIGGVVVDDVVVVEPLDLIVDAPRALIERDVAVSDDEIEHHELPEAALADPAS